LGEVVLLDHAYCGHRDLVAAPLADRWREAGIGRSAQRLQLLTWWASAERVAGHVADRQENVRPSTRCTKLAKGRAR
jgi:hypothetical protein